MEQNITELTAAFDAAKDAHQVASRISTSADTEAQQAWERMNDARIALFSASNPDIAKEVAEINVAAEALDVRIRNLRKLLEDRGLRLPQCFLKTP